MDEIDPSIVFLGKRLRAPILINAMTGGHPDVKWINRALAQAAARTGIAMAVGSQRAGLENPSVRDTYQIVREINPDGLILSNVSADTPLEQVLQAVDMIQADGIQLHLNVAQELAMAEGDRDFRGILNNIARVVQVSPVPVIVKEVGGGIARETARSLFESGVRIIDTGGFGGTNFVQIEDRRAGRNPQIDDDFSAITTAVSLLEVLSLENPLTVVASGGITNGRQIAQAVSIGAGLVGLAGHLLWVLLKQSPQALEDRLDEIVFELKRHMLMAAARTPSDLTHTPVVITGPTAEWTLRRGIDIDKYARR